MKQISISVDKTSPAVKHVRVVTDGTQVVTGGTQIYVHTWTCEGLAWTTQHRGLSISSYMYAKLSHVYTFKETYNASNINVKRRVPVTYHK